MSLIHEIFSKKYGLSNNEIDTLLTHMSEHKMSKGDLLIREGEVNHSVYFIQKGAIRSYYINDEGKDVSLWFGFEGDVAASLSSFIQEKPSIENIEMIEDSVVLKITKSQLLELYSSNLSIANFGRRLAENALLEMEQQILLIQSTDAKSRYLSLVEKFPEILQRVKLGHVASYLGITQVTLSRIRSEM